MTKPLVEYLNKKGDTMKTTIMTICFLIILLPNYASGEFLLGVGTHIYDGSQNINKNIDIMKDIGITSFRDDFKWRLIEVKKGKYEIPQKMNLYLQEASKANIVPLMVLLYGNPNYDGGKKPVSKESTDAFVNFVRFAVKSLAGRVNYFEIWNEWDLAGEPKSADSYFKFVQAVAPAIKQINKDAIVLAGGAGGDWISQLVQLGVLNYVDGISIHPYTYRYKDNRPEAWIKYVAQLSDKINMANNGRAVPLYITEAGWPSNIGAYGTPPEKVGQFLARALLLVRTLPEVKGLWWYDLKNDGRDPQNREHNFGLFAYDYHPKPAYYALHDIAPFIVEGQSFARMQVPSGLDMVSITDDNGNNSFALWSDNGKVADVTLSFSSAVGSSPSVLKVGTGDSHKIPYSQGTIKLPVDGTPQIFTGVQSIKVDKVVW
jgi:hypothetical protein